MDQETLHISVIVPVFNVEKYLSQCLDSILEQTFTNFELILIDDGSLDSCGMICDKYAIKDKRIRVFHQKNMGVSSARNFGLNEAKGKYIVFVDSDDYILPRYLQDLYEALPDDCTRGLVIETVTKLYPNGRQEYSPLPSLDLTSNNIFCLLTELADKYASYPYGKLYSKEVIDNHNIRFLPNVSLLEDLFFLLDYALQADYVYVRPIANYMYRVGFSAVALSTRRRSFKMDYDVFQNYYLRIMKYQKIYRLESNSLTKAWRSLSVFFHRTLISLYLGTEPQIFKDRIAFLKDIRTENKYWITNLFNPDYKADRILKYLLIHEMYFGFDLLMRILLKIKFKYMFGTCY